MVTKYVCNVKGCNFSTENPEEAKRHGEQSHPDVEHPGVKMTIDDKGNVDCESM